MSTPRTRRRATASAALVAVIAVAAAAALAPSSAQAAPKTFFGVVPNADLGNADYELMRRANVGSARISLFWHAIEVRDDQFVWSGTDRLIGAFAARGIRTLPQLFGSPPWVAGKLTKPPVDSARQQSEWMQFLGAVVSRYGPGGTYWRNAYPRQYPGRAPEPIKAWQVWNEQNGPKHFHPKPKVGKYASLLRISKRAIKSRDPRASIVTGGMASKPTGKGGINAWKYVRKLLKVKGARKTFDHVALHPYAGSFRQIANHVPKIRRALKRGGKKKAQTWITEVGWSSRNKGRSKLAKTRKQQANLLRTTYSKLKRKRRSWRIGGVYWYTWRDFKGRGVCRWCSNAGLVKRGLKPKPAYKKYRRVARG